jgi:hypothetical protein
LRDLRSSFKRKYTVYREQKVALSNLVKRIQETIDYKHYSLLHGFHTPHGMLTALKERFSPDEDKRYDPNQPYLEELLHVSVPGKRVILDIPDFRTRNEAIPFGVDELEDDYLDDDDDEEDTDVQDSNLQSDENPSVEKPSESTPIHQLLTPSTTSTPIYVVSTAGLHLAGPLPLLKKNPRTQLIPTANPEVFTGMKPLKIGFKSNILCGVKNRKVCSG